MKRMAIITALFTVIVASSLTANAEESSFSENPDSKVIEDLKDQLEDSKDDVQEVMNKVEEQYSTSSSCEPLKINLEYFELSHTNAKNLEKEILSFEEITSEEVEAAKIASEIASEYEKAITDLQEIYIIPLCSSTDTQISSIFLDLSESHKNYNAIAYLKENGIISGYDDKTFKPENKINRAEFLKILVEGTGTSPDKNTYKNCFPDVNEEWFASYICYAKEKNWISGYPDNTFKPAQTVNKVEAIKMILKTQNIGIPTSISTKPFDDVPIDAWFAPFVKVAKDMGILEETGNNLSTSEDMTRAGVSENLYKTLIYSESHTATNIQVEEEIEIEETQKQTSFSGSNNTSTELFKIDEGLKKFHFAHQGDSNFIVHLEKPDGSTEAFLANEIGNYEGETVEFINDGQYFLQIDADGDWSIEIEEVETSGEFQKQTSFSGTDGTSTEIFELTEGLKRFHFSHNGNSNFIVHLKKPDGSTEAFLANEIGTSEGSKMEFIETGNYFFQVDADGDWSIEIEAVETSGNFEEQTNFSGIAKTSSELFKVSEGLKTFHFSHNGNSNFIVHLKKPDGSTEAFLANEIGNYEGSKMEFIETGNYFFQVDADGDWSIEVE